MGVKRMGIDGRSTPVFLVLFFISGACALTYEIVWTRLLTVVIGNTVFSVTTILTVFMAGLALGSRIAGRIIDQKSVPLIRTYAALEALIGVYNVFLPWLMRAVDPLFGSIYASAYQSQHLLAAARLGISSLLLILPATLMGATLPVLVRYYTQKCSGAGTHAGRVYSANTLGAALGTAIAGFVLVPFVGVFPGLVVGAIVNLGIALVAWFIGRHQETYSIPAGRHEPAPAAGARVLLFAMFLSGVAALMNEVGWTRVLSLVLGPTTYAFTLMLCAMITGIGVGAAVGSRLARRSGLGLNAFAWIEVWIALASMALVPAFGRLPLFVGQLVTRYTDSFVSIQILEFLLMFGLMLVPTTLLGMTFPIAARLYARSESFIGTEVSAIYALNTIGGIAGSLLAGFLLIPTVGSRITLIVAALISAAAGTAVCISGRRWMPLAAAVILVSGIFWIPQWNPQLMTAGAYKYAPYLSRLDLESVLGSGDLLYFKEGTTTTVSVKKYRGRVSLSVDGKVDATDAGDMLTQKLLAHVPLLLRNAAKNVAIVGFGSGVTAGSVLKYPIEKLDVIEISPEVVEGSRFFSHVNHGPLVDPRTELIVGDGRNHLRYVRRTYDVIISEPSNPWMAGMSSLFTREFFIEARSRLSPEGSFCQWIHSYNMSTDDLRTVIGTFRTAFPHAMLWTLNENDFLLLGSPGPLNFDESVLRRNFERVAADLREVQVQDVYSIASMLMLREEDMDRFAAGSRLNTDDLPILEYRAPRFIHSNTAVQNFSVLSALSHVDQHRASSENHRHKAEMYVAAEAFREAREEFQRALRANPLDSAAWKGLVETARTGFGRSELRSFLDEALLTEPTIFSQLAAAEFYSQEGNNGRAVEILDSILKKQPDHVEALERMADALAGQGNRRRLAEIADRLLAVEPENSKGRFHLATVRLYEGRIDESIHLTKRVLDIDPKNTRARNLLAIAYGQTFQPQLAEAEFNRAIELAPDDSTSYNNYGIFLLERERPGDARNQFQRAIKVNPEDAQGFAGMGETFRHEGRANKARAWYERALKVDPNQPVARTYIRGQTSKSP
jgi:spermidine synthase